MSTEIGSCRRRNFFRNEFLLSRNSMGFSVQNSGEFCGIWRNSGENATWNSGRYCYYIEVNITKVIVLSSSSVHRCFLVHGCLCPVSVSMSRDTLQLTKDIIQKTMHRQELRGCGDLFIWFGGPHHKRFQGPSVCNLLLPQTTGCCWLLQ